MERFYKDCQDYLYLFSHCAAKSMCEAVIEGCGSVWDKQACAAPSLHLLSSRAAPSPLAPCLLLSHCAFSARAAPSLLALHPPLAPHLLLSYTLTMWQARHHPAFDVGTERAVIAWSAPWPWHPAAKVFVNHALADLFNGDVHGHFTHVNRQVSRVPAFATSGSSVVMERQKKLTTRLPSAAYDISVLGT